MPTILIADDAGLFVALETSPVLRAGCRLVSVRSGRELLACASTVAPDLFLLDADFLGPSARECLRSIKTDRRLSEIPIVIAAREPGPLEGILSERDRLFAKPVPPDEVGATLTRILPLARRGSPRIALSVPVTCRVGAQQSLRARSKDVGTGGIFLKTPWEPPQGTRFTASFSLPGGQRGAKGPRDVSATFEVVRIVGADETDRIPGLGAAIVEISERDAGLLREFVGAGA